MVTVTGWGGVDPRDKPGSRVSICSLLHVKLEFDSMSFNTSSSKLEKISEMQLERCVVTWSQEKTNFKKLSPPPHELRISHQFAHLTPMKYTELGGLHPCCSAVLVVWWWWWWWWRRKVSSLTETKVLGKFSFAFISTFAPESYTLVSPR